MTSRVHPQPQEFSSLDKAGRRRAVRRSAVHVSTVLAGLAVIYVVVPAEGYDWGIAQGVGLRLPGGMAIFVVVLALQVRRILHAEVPEATAVEAVIVGVSVFLVLFSLVYLTLSAADPQAFTEPLNRLDALYYTTATFATVGFGDIAAVSQLARAAVTVQMLLDLVVIVAVAKAAFSLARSGFRSGP
jgi:voltage-gated potassium channel